MDKQARNLLILVCSICFFVPLALATIKAAGKYLSSGTKARSQPSPTPTPQDEVLLWLRRQYPNARFRPWQRLGTTIAFEESLTRSHVRSMRFEWESETRFGVDVWITGNRPESTAPSVYVTLLDEKGRLISRKDVIDYYSPVLDPGQTDRVHDEIEVPPGSEPAYIAIDEDKDVGLPPRY